MTSISVSRARADFGDLINRVAYGGERIIVRRHGKDVAALVSMDELRLLERVLERLEDDIDIAEADRALAELERRGVIPWDRLKRDLGLG